jgi:hypothetical protein
VKKPVARDIARVAQVRGSANAGSTACVGREAVPYEAYEEWAELRAAP